MDKFTIDDLKQVLRAIILEYTSNLSSAVPSVTPATDATVVSPSTQAKIERDKDRNRRATIRNKRQELGALKQRILALKTELRQINTVTIPNLNKEIKNLEAQD